MRFLQHYNKQYVTRENKKKYYNTVCIYELETVGVGLLYAHWGTHFSVGPLKGYASGQSHFSETNAELAEENKFVTHFV